MSIRDHDPAYGRRKSQRGTHFSVEAKIRINRTDRTDGNHVRVLGLSSDTSSLPSDWEDVSVSNLSSGGLLLKTDIVFAKGDELTLDLTVKGFFSEFDVKTKCVVVRETTQNGKRCYGVAFINLPPDLAVQIDENVCNDRPVSGLPYHGE